MRLSLTKSKIVQIIRSSLLSWNHVIIILNSFIIYHPPAGFQNIVSDHWGYVCIFWSDPSSWFCVPSWKKAARVVRQLWGSGQSRSGIPCCSTSVHQAGRWFEKGHNNSRWGEEYPWQWNWQQYCWCISGTKRTSSDYTSHLYTFIIFVWRPYPICLFSLCRR